MDWKQLNRFHWFALIEAGFVAWNWIEKNWIGALISITLFFVCLITAEIIREIRALRK